MNVFVALIRLLLLLLFVVMVLRSLENYLDASRNFKSAIDWDLVSEICCCSCWSTPVMVCTSFVIV